MADAAPVFSPEPVDEGRHAPGGEELWGESWYLDWAAADCAYGGYVRLGLYPNLGKAWWWIALVGADRPLVLTVEHEMPCPDGLAAVDVAVDGTAYKRVMEELSPRAGRSGLQLTASYWGTGGRSSLPAPD